jgi:hypothetical protein
MSTHGGTSTSAPPATTVTGPDAIGHAAVVGTGLHYARNDHDHGLPILDYNAMQHNDLPGWAYDLMGVSSEVFYITVATVVFLQRVPLPAAMTVTNVVANVGTLGATLTNSFLALFKSDGTIIGQSADQSTAWEAGGATGLYTLPLVGGAKVCTPLAANDFLWTAIYVGSSVTGVCFGSTAAMPIPLLNAGCTAARSRCGYVVQANTATLASFIPSTIIQSNYNFWTAIS